MSIRSRGWTVAPNGLPAYYTVDSQSDLASCNTALGKAAYILDTGKTWYYTNSWAETSTGGDHPDLAAHESLGLAASHAHDYSASGHNHDANYSASGHSHSHNHDGSYSAAAHNHDASYSGAAHNHDASYAPTHAHPYAADDHTHQGGGNPIDAWPVGSVFIGVVSTSPATLLGGGTWSQIAGGRVLVGQTSGDADFDTAEETGGEKTVTLTSNEMPSHSHIQNAHTHVQNAHNHGTTTDGGTTVANGAGNAFATVTASGATGNVAVANATPTNQDATATNQNTGGGAAHNNMPPYLVVYIWKRTA